GRDLRDFLQLPVPAPVSGGPWEMAGRRADGSAFPAEATLTEIVLAGRRLFLCVVRDVGERKRGEQERLEARLPSALATLAVPLAHEFHNALSAVIGFAHLGQRALPVHHPLRGDLEEIEGLGRRAVALVGQLLAAARVQALDRRPIDLNQVVWGCARFLRRILGESVDLRVSTATDLRVVPADPTLVEQVLVNLCRNARDSLPRGGRVTVETRNVRADEAFCRTHPGALPGDYATIGVSDAGISLAPEALRSLFDPFPAPSGRGPGRGPGLAAVRRIAEQHGGTVDVASLPGEGTTMRVYFPVPEPNGPPPAPHSPPPSASQPPRTVRRELVLLVEPDDALRRATAGLLESFGYWVAPASDAEEAERQLRDHAERVGIVLLEAGSPGRFGPSLLEELRAGRPGLRALLLADPGGEPLPAGGSPDPVLRKPFTPEDLADRLRDALGAASADTSPEDPAP
ncbi:MAG: ATP-binding protein, partial [Planctomycetales bacterium]|nr:ATP-binding protein [Planctomycetales bacterium]